MVQVLKRLPLWGTYALLAYMPFSLFLSRWLSLYTGGLGQWDALKDAVTLGLLILTLVLAFQNKFYAESKLKLIFWISAAYGLLHIVWLLFFRDLDTRAALLGVLYNGRVLAYLFIGIIIAKEYGLQTIKTALKILLISSTITCIFALAQYVLPKDLMMHFGYSVERGVKPAFFIDDKPDFPRVMSTVRDPNSFGAYLIVPLTLLWLYVLGAKGRSRLKFAGLLALHATALFLTYSRGAWIGAILALFLVSLFIYREALIKIGKRFMPALIVMGLLILAGTFLLRNHYVFQNVVLHSDQKTVLDDPNELRIQLQTSTAQTVIEEPLGHGPGTAGLASIGNEVQGTLLTENYFLQIAYEVGIFGLACFVTILVVVYQCLMRARKSYLREVLLVSFWSYMIIAFLIHLWSNEVVAVTWWLLAGLIIGQKQSEDKSGKIPETN